MYLCDNQFNYTIALYAYASSTYIENGKDIKGKFSL